MDGRRQIAIATHYIDAFFDDYLKRGSNPEPLRHRVFPEVSVRQ